MHYAYKFRLYPSAAQQVRIEQMFGCCRYVYNHYLAVRKTAWEQNSQSLSYYDCAADLTKLKEQQPWLKQADCSALQNVLRDLDGAYRNFFRRLKNGERPGYPRFKRKHAGRCAYRSQRIGTNIKVLAEQGKVQFPKLGLVNCRISRPVEGKLLSATVSRNPSGKYYVSLCCDREEIRQQENTGRAARVELGLYDLTVQETCMLGDAADPVTVSGERIQYATPQALAKEEKRLKRLQRQLSQKPKGSHRREKARRRAAKLHERVANQRRDWQQKTTTGLLRRYDALCVGICLPDRAEQGRSGAVASDKDPAIAKALADAAWGEFLRQLGYKAQWQGKTLELAGHSPDEAKAGSAPGKVSANTKTAGAKTPGKQRARAPKSQQGRKSAMLDAVARPGAGRGVAAL